MTPPTDAPLIGPDNRLSMVGVVEHAAGHPVDLAVDPRSGRLVVEAYNRAPTRVDLLAMVAWLRAHCPGVLAGDEQASG